MNTRLAIILAAALIAALGLSGCAAQPASPPTPAEVEPEPTTTSPGGAAGLRLAPGLYDLQDGTVQAVGTLEYSDLEGGFWVITGGTQFEGKEGTVIAVIANGQEFEDQLKQIEGRAVFTTGTKLDGVSTRMAGPEIEIIKIEAYSDTPGISE